MSSSGSGLPFWTPFFLLCLLILSGVWGMPLILNKKALEDLFQEKTPTKGDQCPDEVNPVKAFLSWPNNQANVDKPDPEKDTNAGQFFDQQGILNNQVEEPLNSQNLQLNLKLNLENPQPNSQKLKLNLQNLAAMEKFLAQKKELKAQEDVNSSKSKLVNTPMMDYKREFASDEANPYVESLRQRYEPLPFAYKD